MYNLFFYLIIGIVIFFYLLDEYIDHLNTTYWSDELPEELVGIYDEEKYKKSQQYEKETHKYSKFTGRFMMILNLLVLIFFGYGWLDGVLRNYLNNPIFLGLAFFGVIYVITTLISIPFSWYRNFKIEEKYGFNKMTPKIFVTDIIKGLLLSFVLGGLLLSLVIWIYSKTGTGFWIYAWIVITIYTIFMVMFYSNLIVPLFNKQTPLEEGGLKTAIEEFAKKTDFKLDNIFVIDGSKRTTKANAYFTGLGSKKRIVLYDTLIKDYSKEEIVAVLAHEIGHYKKKHTMQMLVFGILETGLTLFLFSLIINNKEIAAALGTIPSFHIGILTFGMLFSPLSEILGILGNMLSRKNEYEADSFAGTNYEPEYLQSSLKKLSTDTLSNLRPHPIYEFVHYSHPTVLKRLANLEKLKKR